jgi:hypothetical protein
MNSYHFLQPSDLVHQDRQMKPITFQGVNSQLLIDEDDQICYWTHLFSKAPWASTKYQASKGYQNSLVTSIKYSLILH